MRIGVHFNYQNYADWDRFEARRTPIAPVTDQQTLRRGVCTSPA